MLQNAKFTAFTISELSRVNQQRGKITPTQVKVKIKETGNDRLYVNII